MSRLSTQGKVDREEGKRGMGESKRRGRSDENEHVRRFRYARISRVRSDGERTRSVCE